MQQKVLLILLMVVMMVSFSMARFETSFLQKRAAQQRKPNPALHEKWRFPSSGPPTLPGMRKGVGIMSSASSASYIRPRPATLPPHLEFPRVTPSKSYYGPYTASRTLSSASYIRPRPATLPPHLEFPKVTPSQLHYFGPYTDHLSLSLRHPTTRPTPKTKPAQLRNHKLNMRP